MRAAARRRLATVLDPDELKEFNLKTSKFADRLRLELSAFNPTDQEMRAIFDLKYNVLLKVGDPNSFAVTDVASGSRFQQATSEAESAIKNALGAERYADYYRARDGAYQTLVALLENSNVSRETINEIYGYKREVYLKMYAIQHGDGTEEQRRQEALAYSREIQKKIADKIGVETLIQYRMSGGNWLEVPK